MASYLDNMKNMKQRNYIQARNLKKEAKERLKNYNSILSRTRKDYEILRKSSVSCNAFSISGKHSKK